MGIIGPSGSLKTEMIRALGELPNVYVYPLDDLSSHTFISGMPFVKDTIPRLKGRLITIKDFSKILAKREDERAAIFGDIRSICDGSIAREFGSGKRVIYNDIHSSFLFASTTTLEGYYSASAILGQRMIFHKPRIDKRASARKAAENMDKKALMRKEIHEATIKLLNHITKEHGNVLRGNIASQLPEIVKKRLLDYAVAVAYARCPVKKNYKGEVIEMAEIESPTRLLVEIIKIVVCHAILYDRDVSYDDIKAGLLVLIGCIPRERFNVLYCLLQEMDFVSTAKLGEIMNLGPFAIKTRLDELFTIGLIDRKEAGGPQGYKWRIKDGFFAVLRDLFDLVPMSDVNDVEEKEGTRKAVVLGVNWKRVYIKNLKEYKNFRENLVREFELDKENPEKFLSSIFVGGLADNFLPPCIREKSQLYSYADFPPTQTDEDRHAKCELCGKVAELKEAVLGNRRLMVCDECWINNEDDKQHEQHEQPNPPSDIGKKYHREYQCLCPKTYFTKEAFDEHIKSCGAYKAFLEKYIPDIVNDIIEFLSAKEGCFNSKAIAENIGKNNELQKIEEVCEALRAQGILTKVGMGSDYLYSYRRDTSNEYTNGGRLLVFKCNECGFATTSAGAWSHHNVKYGHDFEEVQRRGREDQKNFINLTEGSDL